MPLSRRPSAVRSVTDCDHGDHVTLAICLPADAYRQPPRMKALDRMMQYVSGRRTSVWLQYDYVTHTRTPHFQYSKLAIGLAYWFHTPPIKGAMIIS